MENLFLVPGSKIKKELCTNANKHSIKDMQEDLSSLPFCIKEEIIYEDGSVQVLEPEAITSLNNLAITINGSDTNRKQGYSIADLLKLDGASLCKLFVAVEKLPNRLVRYWCKISPFECTRSHTTSDEVKGRDLMTAHLLNHVETYTNICNKDPSYASKHFYPYENVKLTVKNEPLEDEEIPFAQPQEEDELLDVENDELNTGFPEQEPQRCTGSSSEATWSSPEHFTLELPQASEHQSVASKPTKPAGDENSDWLPRKRTSFRLALKKLEKERIQTEEIMRNARTKQPRVVLRNLNSKKELKKIPDATVKSKSSRLTYPPESSSESGSSDNEPQQVQRPKKKMFVLKRKHTLASTLRNRKHLFSRNTIPRKKQPNHCESDFSDSSSDDAGSRAKRKKLYQEPSKVIFKINDEGLLSMQHSDSNQSNEIKFKDEADNIKKHGQTVETPNLKSFEEEKLKRTQSSEVTSTKALEKSSETKSLKLVELSNDLSESTGTSSEIEAKVSETTVPPTSNVTSSAFSKSLVSVSTLIAKPEKSSSTKTYHCPRILMRSSKLNKDSVGPSEIHASNSEDYSVNNANKSKEQEENSCKNEDSSTPVNEKSKDNSTPTTVCTDDPLELEREFLANLSNQPPPTKKKTSRKQVMTKTLPDPSATSQPSTTKKKAPRKQNLSENLKKDHSALETVEKALLGVWNDHCYIRCDDLLNNKKKTENFNDVQAAQENDILFPPSTLQKRVKWIDKSLNSAQATQKYGVEQMESDNDSDSAQIIQIGKSSRKIEPAADPKIKAKALRLISELRHRKPKEVMVCTVRVVDGSRSSYVVQEFYTCEICGKRFTAPNSLYGHYRGHAGIKPFRCDICGQTFTRAHSLSYHAMIHNNTSRFKCKFCGKNFRHPTHYKCPHCKNGSARLSGDNTALRCSREKVRFHNKTREKEHLNRHTGKEPYKCSDCHRRFRTRNTFRRHAMTKHYKVLTPIGSYAVSSKVLQTVTWDK